MSKSRLSRAEAEEFSKNVGGLVTASAGIIDQAVNVLLVPQALGLTPTEWVRDHLGGYVQRDRNAIRDAVRELDTMTDEAGEPVKRTAQQIGDVLGVSRVTVDRARQEIEAEVRLETQKEIESGSDLHLETQGKRNAQTKLDREIAVAKLMDKGKSAAEIAVQLDASIPQIKKDMAAIRKLREANENQRQKEAERKIDNPMLAAANVGSRIGTVRAYVHDLVREYQDFLALCNDEKTLAYAKERMIALQAEIDYSLGEAISGSIEDALARLTSTPGGSE